jgi:hypothetical protein
MLGYAIPLLMSRRESRSEKKKIVQHAYRRGKTTDITARKRRTLSLNEYRIYSTSFPMILGARYKTKMKLEMV